MLLETATGDTDQQHRLKPELLNLAHGAIAQHEALIEAFAHVADLMDEQASLHAQLVEALAPRARGSMDTDGPSASTVTLESHAPSEPATVRMSCFGTFELLWDGRRTDPCHSSKALALFVYLANHRNQTMSRDALLDALWPDSAALAPDSSLNVAAHALRQFFVHLGVGHDVLALETHGSGYRLRSRALWLDVDAFVRCRALATRMEKLGRNAEAMAAYTRAADLYQGDFLPEERADWAVFRREALRDQYLSVLARLGELALASDDYSACLLCCERALAHDPYSEHVYRALMLCHARLGQRSRVRCWYERCASTLRTKLNATPQPETERLYERLMRGEASATASELTSRRAD